MNAVERTAGKGGQRYWQNLQSASIIVTRLFQRRKLRFFLPHISAYNLKVRRMPDVVRMFTFRIAVHACASVADVTHIRIEYLFHIITSVTS